MPAAGGVEARRSGYQGLQALCIFVLTAAAARERYGSGASSVVKLIVQRTPENRRDPVVFRPLRDCSKRVNEAIAVPTREPLR